MKIEVGKTYLGFLLLVAVVSGCAGGAAGSVFSVWSVLSGVSDQSMKAHSICEPAKENLKKEIKKEIAEEAVETPEEKAAREYMEFITPKNPSLEKHDIIHSPCGECF